MGDIFISYAHKDTEHFVHAFASRLLSYGYSVWWDTVSIAGGTRWRDEIENGVRECTYFLPVISANAVDSKWVGKEIEMAQRFGKTIIPIIIDGSDIMDENFKGIADDQGVSFTSDKLLENAYDQLRQALVGISYNENVKTYEDLPDLQELGSGIKFGGLEPDWIMARSYGTRADSPVALLIGDTPFRANAHIVAPRTSSIVPPETVQVFLQFTGATKDGKFQEYLKYMDKQKSKMPLWTIYVQGPYTITRKTEEFRLPDEGEPEAIDRLWRASANFVLDAINRAGHIQHIAFFLFSPNPLAMIMASDRRFRGFPYDIYHYREHERVMEKKYVRVFSTG